MILGQTTGQVIWYHLFAKKRRTPPAYWKLLVSFSYLCFFFLIFNTFLTPLLHKKKVFSVLLISFTLGALVSAPIFDAIKFRALYIPGSTLILGGTVVLIGKNIYMRKHQKESTYHLGDVTSSPNSPQQQV